MRCDWLGALKTKTTTFYWMTNFSFLSPYSVCLPFSYLVKHTVFSFGLLSLVYVNSYENWINVKNSYSAKIYWVNCFFLHLHRFDSIFFTSFITMYCTWLDVDVLFVYSVWMNEILCRLFRRCCRLSVFSHFYMYMSFILPSGGTENDRIQNVFVFIRCVVIVYTINNSPRRFSFVSLATACNAFIQFTRKSE